MSVLTQLFGGVESGNNPNQGLQPTGTIGGQYQQSLGFQQQFGGNTSGSTILDPVYQEQTLNTFASTELAANPNLSAGDLYALYNTGPNSGATFSDLPANVQNNFNSNAAALGISAATPAAALGSSGLTVTSPDLAPGASGDGSGTTATPGTSSTASPTTSTSNNPSWFSSVFSNASNYLLRGALIVIALVLLGGAVWALAKTRDVPGGAKAALKYAVA